MDTWSIFLGLRIPDGGKVLTSAGAAGSVVPLPKGFKDTSSYDAAVADVGLLAGALTLVLSVVVIIEFSLPNNSGGRRVHQNNADSRSTQVTLFPMWM